MNKPRTPIKIGFRAYFWPVSGCFFCSGREEAGTAPELDPFLWALCLRGPEKGVSLIDMRPFDIRTIINL